MQCSSCGATLQPGMTKCPSCGAPVSTDTADSPYEEHAGAVPYIPYTPLKEREAAPASSAAPAAPAAQESPPSTNSAVGSAPQQAASQAGSGPLAQALAMQPPVAQQPPQRQGLSPMAITLSVILALLIIGGAGGLIYYLTGPYPAEQHAQATAVVQNVLAQQQQANAQATATVNALGPQDFYSQVTSTKPAISDPMSRSEASSWIGIKAAGSGCSFTNGAYHVSAQIKGDVLLCPAILGNNFSNLIFQVQMTIIKGDGGGLLFRANNIYSGQPQVYYLEIDQFGDYALFIFQNSNRSKLLKYGLTSAINTGLNQANQVAVVARGSNFYFYLNKQYFAYLSDSTYSSGMIGVLAASAQHPTEVAFSNAQVWIL
jgi:hypothetical protein